MEGARATCVCVLRARRLRRSYLPRKRRRNCSKLLIVVCVCVLQTEYAQKMGAIAVIVNNNVGGIVVLGAASGVKISHLKIPVIFVLKTEGEALAKEAVKTALVSFHCKALRASPPPPNRGSPSAPPLNPRGHTRRLFEASAAG